MNNENSQSNLDNTTTLADLSPEEFRKEQIRHNLDADQRAELEATSRFLQLAEQKEVVKYLSGDLISEKNADDYQTGYSEGYTVPDKMPRIFAEHESEDFRIGYRQGQRDAVASLRPQAERIKQILIENGVVEPTPYKPTSADDAMRVANLLMEGETVFDAGATRQVCRNGMTHEELVQFQAEQDEKLAKDEKVHTLVRRLREKVTLYEMIKDRDMLERHICDILEELKDFETVPVLFLGKTGVYTLQPHPRKRSFINQLYISVTANQGATGGNQAQIDRDNQLMAEVLFNTMIESGKFQ